MRSSYSSNKKMRISTPPKKPSKVYNDVKGESMEWSFIGMDQLMLMMKVHKKIFVFRDIMDLAPLNTSASLREVIFTFLHGEVTQNVLASFITLSFMIYMSYCRWLSLPWKIYKGFTQGSSQSRN